MMKKIIQVGMVVLSFSIFLAWENLFFLKDNKNLLDLKKSEIKKFKLLL